MNKAGRILLCIAVTLAVMGTAFRPGVRVIVAGQALPGIYDPAVANRCAAEAHAAALEICRGQAVADYKLIPVLTVRTTQPQTLQLTRVLLESYRGVERVYAIRAGSAELGAVESLAEAYRLCQRYPRLPLSVVPTYTYTARREVSTVMAELENYAETYRGPF